MEFWLGNEAGGKKREGLRIDGALNLSGFQLFDTLEGLPDQRVPRLTLR